jgi:hypothetical protein
MEVESPDREFSPKLFAEWLEGRMPRSVDDSSQWRQEEFRASPPK